MKIVMAVTWTLGFPALAMAEPRIAKRDLWKAMGGFPPPLQESKRQLIHDLMRASRKLENDNLQQQEYRGQAFADVGNWNGEYWEFDGQVPFDLSSRAFKYSGCAAIKSYDADSAYNTGNPFIIENYAVFRFCPVRNCNKLEATGCSKNYGEYAVEMKTYLSYVMALYEERHDEYCNYCATCDGDHLSEAKSALQQCYADLEEKYYEQSQQNQQQSWQEYYAAHNGDMSGWNANGDKNGYQQSHNAYGYYKVEGDDVYGQSNNDDRYWNRDLDGNDAESNAWYSYQDNKNGTFIIKNCADYECDECESAIEDGYGWCDADYCEYYDTLCSAVYDEDEVSVLDFVECTQYDTEEGTTYFIGPRCGADHFTISLGLFTDANCLDYAKNVSISDVVGDRFDAEDPFTIPEECVSCDATAFSANSVYNNSPETDQDGALAACRALYQGSAKCNLNLNNFGAISRYMSQYEIELEKTNCAFANNIINGAYDESGDIRMKLEVFDFKAWRSPRRYPRRKMTKDQAFLLSMSIVACITALASVIHAHRLMNPTVYRRQNRWGGKLTSGEMPLSSRQHSRLRMARSRSGPWSPII